MGETPDEETSNEVIFDHPPESAFKITQVEYDEQKNIRRVTLKQKQ